MSVFSVSLHNLIGLLGLALFAALFLSARLVLKPAPPPARLTAVVALPVLFITSVATLNYVANPFGLFRTRFFEPIVLHSRAEKMNLYARRQPPPEVVVLGSSPSFTMPPSYIEARTGKRAFNASMHGGTPRDFLAFTRYMIDRGRPPRFLVVSVRVEQFRPDTRVGFEPGDPLESYLKDDPGVVRSTLDEAETLLTLEQTEASLRLLAVEVRGRSQPHYRFDATGLARFSTYSLDEAVEGFLAEAAKSHHLQFRELSPSQLGYLERFLTLCREKRIQVIAYVPPYHPRLAALWERQTRLPELKGQLLGRLASWQTRGGLTVHDLSRLESFGGTDRMFHDALHPNEEANRRILDVLLKDVS